RAVQRVVIEHLMTLAADADMSQVRAIATAKLRARAATLPSVGSTPAAAHASLLAADIKRFLDRPAAPAARTDLPAAPLARRSESPPWNGCGGSSRRARHGESNGRSNMHADGETGYP
ncbi:MAG TPA: hypothetical protein VNJ54_20430, partial [Plantibacter sp.]|uniref:hypothetical protein n=1 Tax=Plantibacter sp. TaxID=1871045 RepID=UPI002B56C95D|nr:hypothetical protein [Plantibacter sp.]